MSVLGFFLFGMAFGAISMSCTLPIFLMVVGSSIAAGDFTDGLFQFVSYDLDGDDFAQIKSAVFDHEAASVEDFDNAGNGRGQWNILIFVCCEFAVRDAIFR